MADQAATTLDRQDASPVSIVFEASVLGCLSLRARPDALPQLSAAWGDELDIPMLSQRTSETPGQAAWRLGPDEWWLFVKPATFLEQRILLSAAARETASSLTDIGERQCAIELVGDKAALLLAAGCPLDLSLAAFPVGHCTRTVFGRIEIVLARTGPDRFHIEVWRSFSEYLLTYLKTANQDL